MSDDFRLPPPSFEFLVYSLKMQAEMHLGLFKAPGEDKTGPNLIGARHTIDLLAMLSEKTKGNLTLEEQRTIENSLTELRFRYVQANRDTAAASSGGAQASETAQPAETPKPPDVTEAPKEESAEA